jgi:hypothetical protein
MCHKPTSTRYSITPSARRCIELGTVTSIIFAARKLTTNSNVVGRVSGIAARPEELIPAGANAGEDRL